MKTVYDLYSKDGSLLMSMPTKERAMNEYEANSVVAYVKTKAGHLVAGSEKPEPAETPAAPKEKKETKPSTIVMAEAGYRYRSEFSVRDSAGEAHHVKVLTFAESEADPSKWESAHYEADIDGQAVEFKWEHGVILFKDGTKARTFKAALDKILQGATPSLAETVAA